MPQIIVRLAFWDDIFLAYATVVHEYFTSNFLPADFVDWQLSTKNFSQNL